MSRDWTFLSNHSHVLICLARAPDSRMRDIAAEVGITERAVQKIIAQMEAGEILAKTREGRRNHYRIRANATLRHPVEAHCTIGDVLSMVLGDRARRPADEG